MDRVYCHSCWLFSLENVSPGTSYALQNSWGTRGLNDWRLLLQRIRSHESSTQHAEALSYVSNGETGDDRKSVALVFAGKNILLAKSFEKTSACYIDVGKVQLTFARIQ